MSTRAFIVGAFAPLPALVAYVEGWVTLEVALAVMLPATAFGLFFSWTDTHNVLPNYSHDGGSQAVIHYNYPEDYYLEALSAYRRRPCSYCGNPWEADTLGKVCRHCGAPRSDGASP